MNLDASIAAAPARRYASAAILLHWLIAALIIGQIGLGWYFADLSGPAKRSLENIHISVGLTILLLTVLRVALRLLYRPPSGPPTLASWERRLAATAHVLFYVLLVAIPLTGWAMESVGPRPLPFWGLDWPHLPGLELLLQGRDRREVKEVLEQVHGSPLVWAMISLVGLHVLGALKHQFDGSPVLWRMLPFLKAPPPAA
jgi:cytochrome b561